MLKSGTVSIILCVFLLSCSSGNSNPIQPDAQHQESDLSASEVQVNRSVLYYGIVMVDETHTKVEAVPCRSTAMHFNVLKPIEEDGLTNGLQLTYINFENSIMTVEFKVKHPFPHDATFTVFDMRGIFISHADYTFPYSGASMNLGDEHPKLRHEDGYTSLFNPIDYPPSSLYPDLLEYYHGQYAQGSGLNTTVNPFVAFYEGNNRHTYLPWIDQTKTISIYIPDGPFFFGYAFDASWAYVPGPINDPENQFPPEANSPEGFEFYDCYGAELSTDPSDATDFGVIFYHRTPAQTIKSVTVEAPDLFNGVRDLTFLGYGLKDRFIYSGEIRNEKGADYGTYPLLIKATELKPDPNLGEIAAYHLTSIRIKHGWARSIGTSIEYSEGGYGRDSCTLENGDILMTGSIQEGDLNPGPPYEPFEWQYYGDAFLCRFSETGKYLRTITWGGEKDVDSQFIVRDANGNIYVSGEFEGAVDFDPGPGVYELTGASYNSTYVSKFNQVGQFLWARAWDYFYLHDFDIDPLGNPLIMGYFGQPVDFDPDPAGEDIHVPPSGDYEYASGIIRLDSDGIFMMGAQIDSIRSNSLALTSDSILLSGYFEGTADFDPSDLVYELTSNGDYDCFLARYTSDMDLIWAYGWGSSNESRGDECKAIAMDNSGSVYGTGTFWETADFDPGPSELILNSSTGEFDAFLVKYSVDGDFIWAKNWGGDINGSSPDQNEGRDIAVNSAGSILVLGQAGQDTDYDPGPGTAYSQVNNSKYYLSRFYPDGTFDRVWNWKNYVNSINLDSFDNALLTCGYAIDADPGEGQDIQMDGAILIKLPADGVY